jgi:hypothetical protein
MEIAVAEERALILQEKMSLDQAEGRAWGKKVEAFGTLAKMTGFLQRPKDNDFELIYKEHRYQPFWHIVCSARYIYERNREFKLALGGPEVEQVTISGTSYGASGGQLTLTGVEHCREEPRAELFVEGLTGEKTPALASYLTHAAVEVPAAELGKATAGRIIVPPQARASAIVREVLAGMIKSLVADRILEERVDVERVDLYYRPVYAFQYRWLSKEKEAVLEYDGLTGEMNAGGATFQQYVGKYMDAEFLFDVGVETVNLIVPGGGLALKLAKKGLEVARQ